MSVEAEQLDDWVGAEVLDTNNNKLGKVSEVYYRGPDALVVEFRSGLIGHKHHLAGLSDATVSKKHLRLGVPETIATDGGLDDEGLELLARSDGRLENLTVADLESGTARKTRLEEARQAQLRAEELEKEAVNRADEAAVAAKVAKETARQAESAEQAKLTAEQQATAARQRADELGGEPEPAAELPAPQEPAPPTSS